MKIRGVLSDYELLEVGANMVQRDGDHYINKPIQPWDYIAANSLDYFQGNIVKYVTRFREKGGVNDLMKAQHYLQKLIELEQQKSGDQKQGQNQQDGVQDQVGGFVQGRIAGKDFLPNEGNPTSPQTVQQTAEHEDASDKSRKAGGVRT